MMLVQPVLPKATDSGHLFRDPDPQARLSPFPSLQAFTKAWSFSALALFFEKQGRSHFFI